MVLTVKEALKVTRNATSQLSRSRSTGGMNENSSEKHGYQVSLQRPDTESLEIPLQPR